MEQDPWKGFKPMSGGFPPQLTAENIAERALEHMRTAQQRGKRLDATKAVARALGDLMRPPRAKSDLERVVERAQEIVDTSLRDGRAVSFTEAVGRAMREE